MKALSASTKDYTHISDGFQTILSTDSVATALAAGGNHSCALMQNGQILCWGTNSNGQLGSGSTAGSPSTVLLGELYGFRSLWSCTTRIMHWHMCTPKVAAHSCEYSQVLILPVISPDFSLELTGFFPGKLLIHFLVLKMKDFRNFVLHNCILDFDAEQVYLKPQVFNLKNKEVTANPKTQTLEKNWFFENPIP